MSRPSLDEIQRLSGARGSGYAALSGSRRMSATAALIEVGLNHEQQHQELILTDIKHALLRQCRCGRNVPTLRAAVKTCRAAAVGGRSKAGSARSVMKARAFLLTTKARGIRYC